MTQRTKVAFSYESGVLLYHVDSQEHGMAPEVSGELVMLWAIYWLETLDSGIRADVTVTCTTFLNTAAEGVHHLMATVFSNGSSICSTLVLT